jgi:hypothetical protein
MDARSGNILRNRGLPGFHLVDEPGDPTRRDLVSLRESACFYLAIECSSAEGHEREDLLHAQHRPDVTARPVFCSFVDHSPSCPQLALMRAMMTTSILTPAQWSPNRFPRNSSGTVRTGPVHRLSTVRRSGHGRSGSPNLMGSFSGFTALWARRWICSSRAGHAGNYGTPWRKPQAFRCTVTCRIAVGRRIKPQTYE